MFVLLTINLIHTFIFDKVFKFHVKYNLLRKNKGDYLFNAAKTRDSM
jgi:hypothetical protein